MAKIAFGGIPGVIVADPSQMEIVAREGVNGIQKSLSKANPNGLVFQIMGDDSFSRAKENSNFQFYKRKTAHYIVESHGVSLKIIRVHEKFWDNSKDKFIFYYCFSFRSCFISLCCASLVALCSWHIALHLHCFCI